MNMKIHFVVDKNIKTRILKENLLKSFKNYSAYQSNVLVVIGGDGFMLQTLKKYQKYNKPFYGINRGTFGFLMNKFKTYDIDESILKSKLISISPLTMKVLTKTNLIKSLIRT